MGRKPGPPRPPRTRLEEIRRQRGMTLADLAERVGIDPAHLYRMEIGQRGLTTRWRDKLAKALAVRPELLFAQIGDPIPYPGARAAELEARPYAPAHAAPEVARRLLAVMQDCGLQEAAQVAAAIGSTEADVIDWLSGRMLPPLNLMNRLANRAGVTLVFLYFGDEAGLLPGAAVRLRALLAPDA